MSNVNICTTTCPQLLRVRAIREQNTQVLRPLSVLSALHSHSAHQAADPGQGGSLLLAWEVAYSGVLSRAVCDQIYTELQ